MSTLFRKSQRATGAADAAAAAAVVVRRPGTDLAASPAAPPGVFGPRLPAAGATFTLRSGQMSLPFATGDAACVVHIMRGDRRTGRVVLSFFTPGTAHGAPASGLVSIVACRRLAGGDLHQRGPGTCATLDAARRECIVLCDTRAWFEDVKENPTVLVCSRCCNFGSVVTCVFHLH